MGIVHFAPVGTSPGAVTSALAYLKRHEMEVKDSYEGDIIESVVLFCSFEVDSGDRPADDYIWNDYGRRNHRHGWRSPQGAQNVIEIVRDFVVHEQFLVGKDRFCVLPVNVNRYEGCFEAVAKA